MRFRFGVNVRSALGAALMACGILFVGGCVGINDNTRTFLNPPAPGMLEIDLLTSFGAPHYAGFAENQKVYIYKVRNHKYIVLVGIYEGYDMVVVCDGGEVTEVVKVERPTTFALLQPMPWAETIN